MCIYVYAFYAPPLPNAKQYVVDLIPYIQSFRLYRCSLSDTTLKVQPMLSHERSILRGVLVDDLEKLPVLLLD